MPLFDEIGVRAVVENTGRYVADANRVNQATAGMGRSAKSAEDSFNVFARAQDRQQLTLRETGARMREAGTQSLFLGAALAAPGALALKFAIDFESAFAGVRKTVDASEDEFARLRQGILDLSGELPLTASGIAGVVESAGQLGIANENLLSFARTVVQLGEATNLTADEAAVAFARFANIVGVPQSDIDRLGSTVVDLGNNFATTEGQIVDFALRIGGAGRTVGLSADEILGLAAALASVGLRSEAGGTAISRTLVEIAKAVSGGGEALERFAKVADQSTEDFAKSFETDPAAAVQAFISGLGTVEERGMRVFQVLDDLSLADNRVRDALLRAAGASDLFGRAQETASRAFEENTALTEEFARRLDTASTQLRLLINEIQRAAIDIGSDLLPVLRAVIARVGDAVELFGRLPQSVRLSAVAFSLVGGSLLVLIGVAGIFAGTVLNLIGILGTLRTSMIGAQIASLGLSATPLFAGVGIAAVLAGGLFLAARALGVFETASDRAAESQQRLADAIEDVTTKTTEQLAAQAEAARQSRAKLEAELAGIREEIAELPEVPQVGGRGPTPSQRAILTERRALEKEERRLETAIRDETTALGDASLALETRTLAENESVEAIQALIDGTQEEIDALETANAELDTGAKNARTYTVAQREAQAEAAANAAEIENLKNTVEILGAALGIAEQRTNAETVALDANTAATKANADAKRDLARAQDAESVARRGEATRILRERGFAPEPVVGRFADEGAQVTDFEISDRLADQVLRSVEQLDTEILAQSTGVRAFLESNKERIDALRDEATAADAATVSLSALEQALQSLTERREREQVGGLIRDLLGADPSIGPGLAEVRAEQNALDRQFAQIAPILEQRLGVVPELFFDLFEQIRNEAEEGVRDTAGVGGLLGFLIAKRFNEGRDPTAGLISQPASVTAALTAGTPRAEGVNIENVNITDAFTTGDVAQGMGVGVRAAFGSVG